MAKKKSVSERKEKLLQEIGACKDRHGEVQKHLIVEAAKNPRTILHSHFEWDDRKAAYAHRLEKAGELLREYKFYAVYEDVKHAVPVYVRNPGTPSGYIATAKAARDEEVAEMVLQDELRRIENSIIRARGLAVAFGLVEEFDRLLGNVVDIRGRVLRKPRGGDRPESRPSL